ncbi:hypothetical protein T10_1911 [Trichinella papuae]|uniref:Uncharacterized protein n=1 Tax=Trichinella papuae TaxID=268474 RepID=A0A0V1M0Z1_9BILA|nr:hypothetical protein T10_1283 [Trichinella papuae]KRZ71850.1 hypothetical protein T10_1911 [Trichinella papuae]
MTRKTSTVDNEGFREDKIVEKRCSKERILEIAPRMFVTIVSEMRLYFCAREMNIAEQIFSYYPQRTTTVDLTYYKGYWRQLN